jgi:hypothetical protein
MILLECKGYELEKEKPNTSEDFFNRSEVKFIDDDGSEKTFHLLYVRFFEEKFSDFTPYDQDPILTVNGTEYKFRDIVGLVCMLKKPDFRKRKRVYINTEKEFCTYFKGIDFEKLPEILGTLAKQQPYELKSPLLFIQQPN